MTPDNPVSTERLQELIEWHHIKLCSGARQLTRDTDTCLRELQSARLKLAEVERAERYCVECGCTVLFPPPKGTPDAEGAQ